MNLISTFLIILFGLLVHASPPEKNLRACDKNSDCVVVDGSLCGCAWLKGQEQFAVNKKHKAKVEKQFESERKGSYYRCGGVNDDDVKKCEALRGACIANLCEVR